MEIRWRITLFGELRAEADGRVLTRFRRQKTGSLLAYLAYYPHRSHLRDALLELFWPEAGLPIARNNLSGALTWLRQHLEPPGIPPGAVLLADRTSVRLNPDAITTDVAEFQAALQAAERASSRSERVQQLKRAVELYQGELLVGYYEEWLVQPREWLQERYFQALEQLTGLLAEAGEGQRAIEYARRGVEVDLLREEAHRELIRLLAAAGQPHTALRQYRELERVLRQELDTAPSAASRALARDITALAEQTTVPQLAQVPADGAAATAHPPDVAGAPLPTGAVTFLLTDIEGSTRLWQEHRAAMPALLARHDLLLTEATQRQGGLVVKSRGEGDSLFAVFPRPSQAVAAAAAVQQALLAEPWPEEISLRVRIAVHTGEAELREGDYYGPAINRCARLRAIGHGGQILLSLATAQIVGEELPEGMSLRDLGVHRLKDLQRPEHVFQLLHPDLAEAFPPLKSLEALPNNLPRQLTSFIGREREIKQIRRQLASSSLLTLTGTGGCGKTRLALQVAAELLEEYADGVWWVELAALSDLGLVPQAVATALGLREEPGRSLLHTLTEHLRPKSLLLLLDNCEHLIGACRVLADGLLRACPGVRILATSREALNLPGETLWRVPSLLVPDPQQRLPVEEISRCEGTRLFIERASASQPAFAVTERNAPALAEVCQRLDGMPLAIELAAARVKVLSVEQINRRLEDRFRLLTGGNPLALPRQQTLRATLDWSYDLLAEEERRLLRRLSVFAGGWTLEAAEGVCSGEEIEREEVLDLLGRLVDRSLVIGEEGEEAVRYRLLETIRQYGLEKLRASGEEAALCSRHRDWYVSLAEHAAPELTGRGQGEWLMRLEAEHENIRAALAWCMQRAEAGAGLRLGGALWRFWTVRGHLTEGRNRLAGLLALTGAEAWTSERGRALNGAGVLSHRQGDFETARALFEESLAIYRQLGDQQGIAISLNSLGNVAADQGDYEAARALYEESLTIQRQLGDQQGIAASLNNLGLLAQDQGDYEAARVFHEESLEIKRQRCDYDGVALALQNLGNMTSDQGDYEAARALYEESLAIRRQLSHQQGIAHSLGCLGALAYNQRDYKAAWALFEESLAICRQLGDQQGIAVSLNSLGNVASNQGDYGTARGFHEESLEICRQLGDQQGVALALHNLGDTVGRQGDQEAARAFHEESLEIRDQLGDQRGIACCLEGLATIRTAQGQPERAAHLFGAAQALREAIGAPLPPAARADHECHVAAARAGLAEEAFAAAWATGRALSLEQAISYALEEIRNS